jgi:hypothetical protein
MYWPIGAPRIYAASKQELATNKTSTSHDGLEDNSQTPNVRDSTNGTAIHNLDGDDEDDEDEEEVEEAESVNDEKPNGNIQSASASEASDGENLPAVDALESNGTSPQALDEDPGGVIVGLKVTRSGHMFATITQATLTVWQTKVGIISLSIP